MNNIVITGYVAKDSEFKLVDTKNGQFPICNVTVANTTGYKDKKETYFFNCTITGKFAESIEKYLLKGQRVLVSGEMILKQYQDANGVNKIFPKIKVSNLELLGSKKDNSSSNKPKKNITDNNLYNDLTPVDEVDDSDIPF